MQAFQIEEIWEKLMERPFQNTPKEDTNRLYITTLLRPSNKN
jgi:hypothetical protein